MLSKLSRKLEIQEQYKEIEQQAYQGASQLLEEEAAEKYGYEQVNAVPQPNAGGSFATTAYGAFTFPVAVEHIKAHVTCARTRKKFIGGAKAVYDEKLL